MSCIFLNLLLSLCFSVCFVYFLLVCLFPCIYSFNCSHSFLTRCFRSVSLSLSVVDCVHPNPDSYWLAVSMSDGQFMLLSVSFNRIPVPVHSPSPSQHTRLGSGGMSVTCVSPSNLAFYDSTKVLSPFFDLSRFVVVQETVSSFGRNTPQLSLVVALDTNVLLKSGWNGSSGLWHGVPSHLLRSTLSPPKGVGGRLSSSSSNDMEVEQDHREHPLHSEETRGNVPGTLASSSTSPSSSRSASKVVMGVRGDSSAVINALRSRFQAGIIEVGKVEKRIEAKKSLLLNAAEALNCTSQKRTSPFQRKEQVEKTESDNGLVCMFEVAIPSRSAQSGEERKEREEEGTSAASSTQLVALQKARAALQVGRTAPLSFSHGSPVKEVNSTPQADPRWRYLVLHRVSCLSLSESDGSFSWSVSVLVSNISNKDLYHLSLSVLPAVSSKGLSLDSQALDVSFLPQNYTTQLRCDFSISSPSLLPSSLSISLCVSFADKKLPVGLQSEYSSIDLDTLHIGACRFFYFCLSFVCLLLEACVCSVHRCFVSMSGVIVLLPSSSRSHFSSRILLSAPFHRWYRPLERLQHRQGSGPNERVSSDIEFILFYS